MPSAWKFGILLFQIHPDQTYSFRSDLSKVAQYEYFQDLNQQPGNELQAIWIEAELQNKNFIVSES